MASAQDSSVSGNSGKTLSPNTDNCSKETMCIYTGSIHSGING